VNDPIAIACLALAAAFPSQSYRVQPWVANYGTIRSIVAPRCSTFFAAAKKPLPGFMQTSLIPLKASRKNRDLEIVSLDVRRERAMLLQQRRRMLTQFPAGRSRLR
jgi:hypothetical protein